MGRDFDQDLFFLLHDVARLGRVAADQRARVGGMTRAQWAILLRLGRHPGLSQKEIADLLEVTPISVARLVDRLAASGLVERRADAQDRRIWRLHLRPAGVAQLDAIEVQRQALAREIIEGVSAQTRAAMIEGLQRMKRNLLSARGDASGAESLCAKPVADLKEST
jgi:MarR family transcriptional regulator for hemolysin